ncbi:unnamed protein product [Calicophoron daubneyi]|uniref:Uncharacterized protein n=1 Tax=Calicophoron daubneyi TaxID=300641 RepID=A0AAV2TJ37_CALDB
MSVVYLGVGQCGTQLLSSFLDYNIGNGKIADTMVLLYNDWLLAQLQNTPYRGRQGSPKSNFDSGTKENEVSVAQMNKLGAEQMGNILAPCNWTENLRKEAKSPPVIPDCGKEVHGEPLVLSHCLSALPEAKLVRCVSSKEHSAYAGSIESWCELHDSLQLGLQKCPIDASWNLNRPKRQTECHPLGTVAALLIYRSTHMNPVVKREFAIPQASTSQPQGELLKSLPEYSSCLSSVRSLYTYLRPLKWNPAPLDQWFVICILSLLFTKYTSCQIKGW